MKKGNLYFLISLVLILIVSARFLEQDVPKVWDLEKIKESVIPFSDGVQTEFLPESIYYRIPTRKIYKTYPVYVPGREPKDYYTWLRHQEPTLVFDERNLLTEEDWVNAGALIFNSATVLTTLDSSELSQIKKDHEQSKLLATNDGIIPYLAYVVRDKGIIEVGIRSCAFCHSKVMDDGLIVYGAQGNMPVDGLIGNNLRETLESNPENGIRSFFESDFSTPWKDYETKKLIHEITNGQFQQSFKNTYGGVMHRTGTTLGEPVSIPDLFYLEQRKYFDHSGRIVHNSIRDLMFYATLADPMELLDKSAGHSIIPWPEKGEPVQFDEDQYRFSDAQLYALAKYLYTLEPPKNPNVFDDDILERGKELFAIEGCVTCHTPPYYSNNKLTPVDGFMIPEQHFERYSVFPISIETDPSHTLNSRRGTGYYKVPSLIGVWNRTALMHGGHLTTLEELLDSARLNEDFVPSGYIPGWRKSYAVKGHPFGFELSKKEKEALISYVNSL